MAFFDFLKGKEYRDNVNDEDREETVEEIVRVAVDEIEEETEEPVGEDVVTEVVENVRQIEKEVNDDVEKSIGLPDEDNETVDEVSLEEESPEKEPEEAKKGFFAKLKEGLEKTKKNIFGGIDAVLGGFTRIDDDLFDELEESLIMADLGVDTTLKIIENLKKRVSRAFIWFCKN